MDVFENAPKIIIITIFVRELTSLRQPQNLNCTNAHKKELYQLKLAKITGKGTIHSPINGYSKKLAPLINGKILFPCQRYLV